MLQINIAGISGLLYLKSPYSAFTMWSTTFSATQRCPPVKNYIYIFNGRLQRFSCWCRKYRQPYTIKKKVYSTPVYIGEKNKASLYIGIGDVSGGMSKLHKHRYTGAQSPTPTHTNT